VGAGDEVIQLLLVVRSSEYVGHLFVIWARRVWLVSRTSEGEKKTTRWSFHVWIRRRDAIGRTLKSNELVWLAGHRRRSCYAKGQPGREVVLSLEHLRGRSNNVVMPHRQHESTTGVAAQHTGIHRRPVQRREARSLVVSGHRFPTWPVTHLPIEATASPC
jgi:hypothetical protein